MIGKLRHRLTIQQSRRIGDGGGGSEGSWDDPIKVATVWGSVKPLSGNERLRAMQLEARVSHRITIRYRTGITTAMRVLFGTRLFNIRAVLNLDERNRWLDIMAEEGVAT